MEFKDKMKKNEKHSARKEKYSAALILPVKSTKLRELKTPTVKKAQGSRTMIEETGLIKRSARVNKSFFW